MSLGSDTIDTMKVEECVGLRAQEESHTLFWVSVSSFMNKQLQPIFCPTVVSWCSGVVNEVTKEEQSFFVSQREKVCTKIPMSLGEVKEGS